MKDEDILKYDNVPPDIAAQYLGTSPQYIRIGLQRGRLPFGTSVDIGGKGKYTYQISPKALINWKNGTSIRDWIEAHTEMLKALLNEWKGKYMKKYAQKISEYFFDDNEIHYVFILVLATVIVGTIVGIIA